MLALVGGVLLHSEFGLARAQEGNNKRGAPTLAMRACLLLFCLICLIVVPMLNIDDDMKEIR